MEKWVEIRRSADFYKMASEHGISPIVARILRNRELKTPSEINAFLSPGENDFHDPTRLPGMDRVVLMLKEKIAANKKIRIIGDYDVDGICSTYILYKGLTYFGADVDFVIPHRVEDGYGINLKLVKNAYDDGIDTIITCDNGISASAQTDYANELGLTMLITDHHEVPFETDESGYKHYIIPNAAAVTDPKLPESEYPFSGICGAFVAFKVISEYAKESGLVEEQSFKELKLELTEFAALATICDVCELKDENRSLVAIGMKLISKSRNLGLRALISATGLGDGPISPYHCGFVIGPCLNASGRLDTSLRALSLLLEKDEAEALKKAQDLKDLNDERKLMTVKGTEKAFEIVDSMETPGRVLVVFLPDCHESLAGIIAGKVREKYNKPAFVITETEKGLKGSGRSIDAYDMFLELNKVSEYLTKFGGHKLAAGISLEKESLDAFRTAINEKCTLTDEDFVETVRIDMELPLAYADINLARELGRLEPFGVGNERPLFAARHVTVISGQRIGKNRNFAKYKVMNDDGRLYELMYFGNPDEVENFVKKIYDEDTAKMLHSGNRVNVVLDICYQADINSFRGRESVSLQMKHYR